MVKHTGKPVLKWRRSPDPNYDVFDGCDPKVEWKGGNNEK